MTGREMQYKFNILAKRDDISSEIIFYFINYAINLMVRGTFTPSPSGIVGFERSQKTTDDLQSIVKMTTLIPTVIDDHTFSANLAVVSDYWFAVRERTGIIFDNCCDASTSLETDIIEATMNNVDMRLLDPFSEHHLLYGKAKPIRVFYSNAAYFYTDGAYTVSSYKLYYISKPTIVTYTNSSNLPEETHEEIVTLAFNLYVKSQPIEQKAIDKKEA